jgi:hypothetical protein
MIGSGMTCMGEPIEFVWESATRRGDTLTEFHSAYLDRPRGLPGLETMVTVLDHHGFAYEKASLHLMRADRSSGAEHRGTAFHLSGWVHFLRDDVRLVLEPTKPEGLGSPVDLLTEMLGARPQPTMHDPDAFGAGPDEAARKAIFEVREARPVGDPVPVGSDGDEAMRIADAVRSSLADLPFDVPEIVVVVLTDPKSAASRAIRRAPGHMPSEPPPQPTC